MCEKSLMAWLAYHAERGPERPLIITADKGSIDSIVCYREGFQVATDIVAFFEAKGLSRRDRVVFSAENHWLYLPLLAACAHLGMALMPLNPHLTRDEISLILSTIRPKLVIADSFPIGVTLSVERLSISEFLHALRSAANPKRALSVSGEVADPCLLIYTSGSSGHPKTVMLTESALVRNGAGIAQAYGISMNDRLYCVLPFHHMNATIVTGCAPLIAGATVVLGPLFGAENAKMFWIEVRRLGVTVASFVPSIMGVLLMVNGEGVEVDTGSLRFAFCGAAPLTADLWQRFETSFGIQVFQGYGLTETTCWAVATPLDRPRVYTAVGVPLPGCEVEIDLKATAEVLFGEQRAYGDETSEVDRRGEPFGTAIGEIMLRGPILMVGYFRDEKLTMQTFREDGFLRTGDMGFIDETGQLHIVARKKEIIIKNGYNIMPEEVDAALNKHPGVVESKTIGVPHELTGEQIVSAVRLVAGEKTGASDLHRFAKDHLAAYKRPDRYVFVGVLPKTPTGKIAVADLRARLSGAAVETRIRALSTWKYKRAEPSDVESLRRIVTRSLLRGEDLSFVAYWGCGRRNETNEIDRMAMDRMCEYISHASCPPAMVRLTLILTDLHAKINGKPAGRIEEYFAAVANDARERGIETIFLSELWAGIDRSIDDLEPVGEDHPLMGKATTRSRKHSENGSPQMTARLYLAACKWDSKAMLARFPESIFLTYDGPSDAGFLPAMSTLYIYSYRRNISKKPWFCDELRTP